MAEVAEEPMPKPRKRGRPRGGASDARERIIAGAVEEFAERGYDGATIRAIAGRAGVDPALVHHYFGSKADLFGAAIDTPIRPDIAVASMLDGPLDDLGERIIRYVLESWEKPEVHKRGVLLLRAGLGNRMMAPVLAGFLARELLGRIAKALGTRDAELRASLAASQIAGLIVTRHVLKFPALVEAPVDELVRSIAPNVQRYLTGEL